MQKKSDLRKTILRIRSSLTEEEQRLKSCIISKKLYDTELFKENENILIYADYNGEVFTKEIIEYCLVSNKKVAVPKVLSEGEMEFFRIYNYDDLAEGYKGIKEPLTKEEFSPKEGLVVVPGVAFDKDGIRIGYGKGFYDRYLERHKEYKKIALAYSCQIVEHIPAETHDERMNLIITEWECKYVNVE